MYFLQTCLAFKAQKTFWSDPTRWYQVGLAAKTANLHWKNPTFVLFTANTQAPETNFSAKVRHVASMEDDLRFEEQI